MTIESHEKIYQEADPGSLWVKVLDGASQRRCAPKRVEEFTVSPKRILWNRRIRDEEENNRHKLAEPPRHACDNDNVRRKVPRLRDAPVQ